LAVGEEGSRFMVREVKVVVNWRRILNGIVETEA
jgi:hypothetical protein